jgi:hypothetical protein
LSDRQPSDGRFCTVHLARESDPLYIGGANDQSERLPV